MKLVKVSYADYQKYLEDLAKAKGIDVAEIKNKMANCGAPGVVQAKVYTYITIDIKFIYSPVTEILMQSNILVERKSC